MIRTNTVLILGAGASKPYGFPTGIELTNLVLQNIGQDKSIKILNELDFEKSDIQEFLYALRRSQLYSVDAFLEHRPEFIEIGKAAIALCLIPYEDPDRLFGDKALADENHWYRHLYNLLNCPFDSFRGNALSIITFNYDRSLEYYLFNALKNTHDKEDGDVLNAMRNIPIIHVHGQLGCLSWEENHVRPYSTDINPAKVKTAASRIKIIHEEISNDIEFRRARSLIEETENIYFLGFGYHQTNLERLKLTRFQGVQAIKGTVMGYTEQETSRIQGLFGPNAIARFCNQSIMQFLRGEGLLV